MYLAVGEMRSMAVERRFGVIDANPRLGKRQDPEPSTTGSTPVETPTSSVPPETTSAQPTSTVPTTSVPIETTSPTTPITTPTTTPVTPPVTSPTSTAIATSEESTPITTPTSTSPTSPTSSTSPTLSTDLVQSSSVASQPSVPATSETSTTSAAGITNAPEATTRVTTVIATNGSGSTVTVVSTLPAAGPTASPSNSGSSTNTGAIVGGVVGGVGGLLLLLALLWFIRRKTHKDKFEENMFAPDRNVDRREMDLAGDDVDDPETVARPYHLPASPTRNEMAMSTNSQPLSAQSHDRPLSGQYDEAAAGSSRPTSGMSYYTQPGSGMGMPMPMPMAMPMPMPMSRDHVAYTQSRTNSTHDHLSQPSEPATSEGGSSSARLMKEREARRLHVANDDGGVIVHTDGGRLDEEPEDNSPREIPPTYDSIGGPSGAR